MVQQVLYLSPARQQESVKVHKNRTAKKLRPGTQKEMEMLHVQPDNHKKLMEEAVKS